MRILFASGKGGAGKTTVTAGLASVWPKACVVADADVEAPDLAIFLRPALTDERTVELDVPVAVDASRCNLCGECVDLCQFNAIIRLGQRIVPFSKMCHACHGCKEICGPNAIVMGKRAVGTVSSGHALAHLTYFEGRSRIGEAMTPPLIRSLLKEADQKASEHSEDLLMDAPPGISCPVTTAARFADLIVLVADPTPFGFHDFRLAVEGLSEQQKPMAVIINRAGQSETAASEEALSDFCHRQNLPVIASLPFDLEAARAYARGVHPLEISSEWRGRFETAAGRLIDLFSNGVSHG